MKSLESVQFNWKFFQSNLRHLRKLVTCTSPPISDNQKYHINLKYTKSPKKGQFSVYLKINSQCLATHHIHIKFYLAITTSFKDRPNESLVLQFHQKYNNSCKPWILVTRQKLNKTPWTSIQIHGIVVGNIRHPCNKTTCNEALLEALDKYKVIQFKLDKEYSLFSERRILMEHSRVFRAMLDDDNFLESQSSQVISHFPYDTFRKFIQFLHFGRIETFDSYMTIFQLYEIADFYMVPSLMDRCILQIVRSVNRSNLEFFIQMANYFQIQFLIRILNMYT